MRGKTTNLKSSSKKSLDSSTHIAKTANGLFYSKEIIYSKELAFFPLVLLQKDQGKRVGGEDRDPNLHVANKFNAGFSFNLFYAKLTCCRQNKREQKENIESQFSTQKVERNNALKGNVVEEASWSQSEVQ
ncbi:hypothetical protein REPUB_Repub07fG0088200 [Reevesia pubescens]